MPEAEHTPAPAQGGEHAEDWMSRRDKVLLAVPEGSWERSGAESQMMTRLLDPPNDTAAQTFEAIARPPAETCVEPFNEPLDGSGVKVADPE